jgi:dihydrofolate reductase
MRRVILQEFVSLDGMASGPNDSVDFVPASTVGDEAFGRRQLGFMDGIDAMLMGRVTYELFADYWPSVTEGDDKPFADKLNAMKKLVFSLTLREAPWGSFEQATIVRDAPTGAVAKLKQEPGKDMVVWGSLILAQSLTEAALIDEYQLVVCPVVLGGGRPLFRDRAGSIDMKLVRSESFDRGTVLLTYATA